MYFVSINENRRMKPIEIVPRSGGGRRGKMIEGMNPTKIYCKHICKYHNVFLCTTNKIIKKEMENSYPNFGILSKD
jgi:hypothetical protein